MHSRDTGKERDQESGLDYFGARYYGSALGRFTSPDPHTASLLHLINPQRWNMYAYGLNSPLFYVDPTGKDAIAVNLSSQVPLLGHMGVILVTKDGGATYAREGPKGGGAPVGTNVIDKYPLPTVSFTDKNVPTNTSYVELAEAVAKIEQQDPSTVNFAYFITSDADTQLAMAYVDQKVALSQKGKLFPYIAPINNCATFCLSVLRTGNATSFGDSVIPNVLFNQLDLWADSVSAGANRKREVVKTKITFCGSPGLPPCSN